MIWVAVEKNKSHSLPAMAPLTERVGRSEQ